MKKVLIPIILILALLMSLSLSACGQKDNGATSDSASADQSATADSRGASSASSAKASANGDEEKSDSSASAEAEKGSGGSPGAAENQQDIVQNDAGENDGEEQSADDPAPEKKAESGSTKQSSDSGSTSSVSPNPAYDDDHRPQFTIVMTDKSSKKEYSAACSYTTDKKDEAYASFFLPAGNYDIAVYEYADKIDKDNPLAESTYNNAKATKRKSVRVYYTPKDERIEVKESASSRTQ
ncbi:hypothetical protein [Ruminococcus difficilis]|uniref:Lipoprotein n=1 Tax=Ruminococcus difficilis TaxID=2763069 RepID=A0A935C480_9FIRM|nr:hypothetical protein [Ruminococcus difficilis]MBK6090121.1 hypothetical protein [Ruminococcus difficilis]